MSHVQVNFLGRNYRLTCGEGEEERLKQLAEDLGERLNLLDQRFGGERDSPGRPPEIMLWIMTALTLLDENADLHEELDYWRDNSDGPDTAAALSALAERLEQLAKPGES